MIPDSLLSAKVIHTPATRSQEAYHAIREQIIALDLAPASFIDETQLCERLSLGRTPVREALIRLSFENLVVILPRRGTIVADLNLSDLRKLYELYLQLETFAVRLAAERAAPLELDRLHAWACTAQERHPGLDDLGLLALDEQAHQLIVVAAHNAFLSEALERLAGHMRRLCCWYATQQRLQTLPGAIDLLVAVVDCIGRREAQQAAERMGRHITIFRDELLGSARL
ncbi:MAG: GntR family transcriptional regulator [Aphanocapsa lilacina HA4352-LM1]|jgi:DNA-binding GntR family transcriptional regulator|nr:GntR family transcriptional regulator [Aphanocapsa lilacina HA4352-LM1]